jgi:hypothetical protein
MKKHFSKTSFTAIACSLIVLVSPPDTLGQTRQFVRGHLVRAANMTKATGQLPASQTMQLQIVLPLRDTAALNSLLLRLYDPTSSDFHHYLSPAEFASRFGPTEQDYASVASFAKQHHLRVTATHPNRTILGVSGSVSDIQQSMHLTLRTFKHPTESRSFYAPDAEPSLDLSVPILHIAGLDNFLDHSTRKPSVRKLNNTQSSGLLMSSDLRAAYAPGVVLNGAGQRVGIFNPPHGFNISDINAYQDQNGISPRVPVRKVLENGIDAPVDASGEEVTLDIDMAIAMAPGLAEVIVYQGSDELSILDSMATENVAKQLSCSWPTPPEGSGADQVYKQFAAQGQSFFSASADAGSYYPAVPPHTPGPVPFYADDSYITVVGGTSLTTGARGSYGSEVVWHDPNFGSSGGGTSGPYLGNYAIPYWQKGMDMSSNFGSTTYRNSPDVSIAADNIFIVLNGGGAGMEGTSAASPLWAGYTALINEQAVQSGQTTVGFLNPSLYALGRSSSYPLYFHDVTSGNNFTSWNVTPNSAHEYLAGPGYDLCTGWGSPTGTKLINALALFGQLSRPSTASQIAVGSDKLSDLSVFALGDGGLVNHITQTSPNGNWSAWSTLGGHEILQLSPARNADGRLELFALGGDHALYHTWESSPGGAWNSWEGLAGHDLQQITTGNDADGRLEIFALGSDKAVYHIWQTSPNGGWGQWEGLAGHDLRQISLARNADGRLELFALGGDDAVYHIWQTTPNGGWSQWEGLAGHDLRTIDATENADGRIELFAIGGNKALYHIWQTAPNGGWGQWEGLGGNNLQQISLSNGADGRLAVFALGGDKQAYLITQTGPNGGWNPWQGLAGHDLRQLYPGRDADGRLELFALGGDQYVYHIWQVSAANQWGNWTLLQ